MNVERFNVNDFRFEHPKIESVLNLPGSSSMFTGIRVESHERVLVFRDGELVEQLGAGLFVCWKGGSNVTWKSVDMREQIEDIQGQEILSADKVSLRVNLVVTHRVVDPLKAVTEVSDWVQALYREAQLALRTAVGGRTLERLLADKDEVSAEIANVIAPKAAAFGVTVSGVGLRDVILPGDMKTILNEVIIAQKQAEANLIRRREETAAARSQVNTAKLARGQPRACSDEGARGPSGDHEGDERDLRARYGRALGSDRQPHPQGAGFVNPQPVAARESGRPRFQEPGSVAQLVEAAVLETVQCWFESSRGH